MVTWAEWEPAGRYLITQVTQPLGSREGKHQIDNGYRVWTCKGQIKHQQPLERCYQVSSVGQMDVLEFGFGLIG